LGAKIGFEIGLFLLKWIGLGILITQGAKLLGGIGIAFGKYVISVWGANGDRNKLESSADLCAEAVKDFILGVLELVLILVAALGIGKAMGALSQSKFGKAIGYDQLAKWVSLRSELTTTKLVTIDVFKISLAEFKVLANSGKVEAVDIFMKKMGTSFKENPLRIEYETKINKLAELANTLKEQGKSQKEIARTLSQMRRELGVEYKDASPPILRDYIYEINKARYNGDPLGPDFKWLMKRYDGDYSKIIEASSRPNPNIDRLLGGFREWLVGKL